MVTYYILSVIASYTLLVVSLILSYHTERNERLKGIVTTSRVTKRDVLSVCIFSIIPVIGLVVTGIFFLISAYTYLTTTGWFSTDSFFNFDNEDR